MQILDEKPETIHLYVVREEEPKPPVFPIVLSALSLIVLLAFCILIPYRQPEIRAVIRVPAVLLPLRTFNAVAQIIPTGVKIYPATTAHGILTITNGSIIAAVIPQGFNISGVATDKAVYVPAGSAEGFGTSTVPAHLLTSGINMPTLSINQVVGSSLYVRNLSPFTGGKPAHRVKVVTAQDKQTAFIKARQQLAIVSVGLHYPCKENLLGVSTEVVLTWRCQFLTYIVPSYMHILGTQLQGKEVLVTVWFVAPIRRTWAK
jgi:hypothetical protein